MVSRQVTKDGNGSSHLSPIEASGGPVTVPDAHLLFTAEFSQIGDNLLLTGQDGTALLIQNHFALDTPPMLLSSLGAMLPLELAAAFVGWMRAALNHSCLEECQRSVKTVTDGRFVNWYGQLRSTKVRHECRCGGLPIIGCKAAW